MALSKRAFLGQALASVSVPVLAPSALFADETPIELGWTDLVPDSASSTYDALRELGVVQHGDISNAPFSQVTDAGITNEYNGKIVRIPGYLVPLDYEGTGVTAAILVPYVGACIHVPPPPPNQLIYVTTENPYESTGLFEPVYVTGMFGAASTATDLAEIGYALSADRIVPYA